MLTVFLESSLPACNPTTCAPCYVTAHPTLLTFTEFIAVHDETYTIAVVPHITQMANGTPSTMYETLSMDASIVTDVELREEYIWTTNGMILYVSQADAFHVGRH
mgnify:CR=1 FL=1